VQTQTGERCSRSRLRPSKTCPSGKSAARAVQPRFGGAGRAGTAPTLPRLGGAAHNNVMMDGVSTMTPAVNAILLRMNVESNRRSESADVHLSGGVRAVQRACRLRRTTRVDRIDSADRSTTSNATRMERHSHTNFLNGDPKARSTSAIGACSIGGPVGHNPAAGNKAFFLLQPGSSRRWTCGKRPFRCFGVPTDG